MITINMKSYLKFILIEYSIIFLYTFTLIYNQENITLRFPLFSLLMLFDNWYILFMIIIKDNIKLNGKTLKTYIIVYNLLLIAMCLLLSYNVFFNTAILIVVFFFKVRYLPNIDIDEEEDLKEIKSNNKYLGVDNSKNKEFKQLYKDTKENIYVYNYKNIEVYRNLMYLFIFLALLLFSTGIIIEYIYHNIPEYIDSIVITNVILSLTMSLKFYIVKKLITNVYYEVNYGNKQYIDYIVNMDIDKNVTDR